MLFCVIYRVARTDGRRRQRLARFSGFCVRCADVRAGFGSMLVYVAICGSRLIIYIFFFILVYLFIFHPYISIVAVTIIVIIFLLMLSFSFVVYIFFNILANHITVVKQKQFECVLKLLLRR